MLNKLKIFFILISGVSLLSGCGGGGDSGDSFAPVSFQIETLVPNANFPASLVQAPDGRIFYGELLTGNIRVLENGVLSPNPIVSLDVLGTGNEGLLGLALDPDFNENGFLYTYYTAIKPMRNTVVRYTVKGNIASNPQTLVDNLPAGGHNGGRLVFGKDKTLFISVGDAGQINLAQSLSSYAGKILRINKDGSVPSNNPYSGSPIFALGLRNAFGLSIDPREGTLYASDNGPNCDDELNRVPAGANLGWREGQPCGDTDPNFIQPLIRFNPSIAPTGITFYRGSPFPALQNNLLLADYLTGSISRFEIESGNGAILNSETLINGELGELVDVVTGNDGYIYILSSMTISRLVPN